MRDLISVFDVRFSSSFSRPVGLRAGQREGPLRVRPHDVSRRRVRPYSWGALAMRATASAVARAERRELGTTLYAFGPRFVAVQRESDAACARAVSGVFVDFDSIFWYRVCSGCEPYPSTSDVVRLESWRCGPSAHIFGTASRFFSRRTGAEVPGSIFAISRGLRHALTRAVSGSITARFCESVSPPRRTVRVFFLARTAAR